MADVAVTSGSAWVCPAEKRHLADVLLIRSEEDDEEDDEEELGLSHGQETDRSSPVVLEQVDDACPCVLKLQCSSSSSAAIRRLLVISEARTMEVYDQTGEYCGTVRGQRDHSVHSHTDNRGPFYRKRLILDEPSTSCEVKLLSLSGRNSVLVSRIVVGLWPLKPRPLCGPGIDMQQVQCLVDEMGTSLSPGAQNLMNMVHFQQKQQQQQQSSSLAGFLPLLMSSGCFSVPPPAAASSSSSSSSAANLSEHSSDSTPSVDEALMPEDTVTSSSSSCPQSDVNTNITVSSNHRGPLAGHTHLAEMMMSHFLKGGGGASLGADFLPALQSVCGHVTQLRLDDAAASKRGDEARTSGSWELDAVMERRLDDMERRLKEHVDRRLDALEQKLQDALQRRETTVSTASTLSTAPPCHSQPSSQHVT
ncbi:ATPase PAAT isoform X3 [Solea solea]|uniref:ATPase PAAT isoform X3 n=1 Tax=Solea solea TaxID=90069 RepID=UPI002729F045|nr:ATPase PAAT isoform X3 [Solea solea]